MVKALADAYAYLTEVVGDKNTSIVRLRKLLFGAKTEKTAMVSRDQPPDSTPSAPAASECPFGSVRRGDRPWRSARRQGIAAGYRDPAAERIFPEGDDETVNAAGKIHTDAQPRLIPRHAPRRRGTAATVRTPMQAPEGSRFSTRCCSRAMLARSAEREPFTTPSVRGYWCG